jgi:hypothetical protein
MSTSTYRIPSATDESRTIVTAAEKVLTDSPETPAHVALGLDGIPSEKDAAQAVEDAEKVLTTAKHNAQTFSRLRFEGVRLAYSLGQVGKGKAYANQRDLARALGMTQGRVSQILTAQKDAEKVAQVKRTLRDAAKQGGVSDIEGVSSTLHAIAVDASPDEVAQAVEALQAGRIPSGPARTLDVDALVKAAEKVLTMSGEVVNVDTDRDQIERVVKMLTTARANLSAAIKTEQAHIPA